MKTFSIVGILLLIIALPVMSQAQDFLVPDYVFGGVAIDKESEAAPAFPFLGFAYQLEGKENLSFTSMDFTPVDVELGEGENTFLGQRFRSTVRTGLARQLFEIKSVSVYALGDIGIVNAGGVTTSSVGWGGFVHVDINDWCGALVILQGERSPLEGTNLKPRFGVEFNVAALMGK